MLDQQNYSYTNFSQEGSFLLNDSKIVKAKINRGP